MHETNGENNKSVDPLAEIVRAAGRRTPPPQQHYDQVYAATHAVWQRKLRKRQHRNWYALAATVAMVGLGALLWQSFSNTSAPTVAQFAVTNGRVEIYSDASNAWIPAPSAQATLPPGARIRTGDDGATALRLVDGGSLRLSANTELSFGATAVDLEHGTMYFDSAGRREGMTIDVVTALGTVRDIGTQFEVRTDTQALRVRIRSGSIALLDSTAENPIAGMSGEEIRLSAQGRLSRREFAPDDPDWAWAQSLAVAPDFDTPTVLRYLNWIADETGRKLNFESETVRLQAELARFSGDPRDLMPTQLLETIAATSDFDYVITDDGVILISRKP